jgi:LPS O-antigen subunit length determinant protein (WzzB/FepE family)
MTNNNLHCEKQETSNLMDSFEEKNVNCSTDMSNEVSIRKIVKLVWERKVTAIFITFLTSLIGLAVVLNLPNIYQSDVLLAPTSQSSGMNISGDLGGLAALAGVNLDGRDDEQTKLALQVIKSRQFVGRFATEHNVAVALIAAVGWDQETNSLIIDQKIYNTATDTWVREVQAPLNTIPSLFEIHKKFINLIDISEEPNSDLFRLSVQHYSPFIAKQWADELVKSINNDIRRRDIEESTKSIEYLNRQIRQTELSDVKPMLFSLIEEQTKTLMLANIRQEYVFKTIDKAIVAERKLKPKRTSIVILFVLFGFILSLFYIVLTQFLKKSKQKGTL